MDFTSPHKALERIKALTYAKTMPKYCEYAGMIVIDSNLVNLSSMTKSLFRWSGYPEEQRIVEQIQSASASCNSTCTTNPLDTDRLKSKNIAV
jgi:hypothetical protein